MAWSADEMSKEATTDVGRLYSHFTATKKDRFIETLRSLWNVSAACRAVGVDRRTAYYARENDPEFAVRWRAAEEEFADKLEQEAFRRAHDGIDKPVHYEGRRVDTIRQYSDTLLIFLLKGNRKEKYAERMEHTGAGGGPIQNEQHIELETRFGTDAARVYGDPNTHRLPDPAGG